MSLTRSLTRPLTAPLCRAITEAGVVGNPLLSAVLREFGSGEMGWVYDNNDLASFYSDSAMTTLAVVNGPVGGQRDKSPNALHRTQPTAASRPTLRGTPTGASLVTNGDFASGLTGWTNIDTAPGTTSASGGGAAMNNGTTGTSRLRQALTVGAGSYLLTFTVTNFAGATNVASLSLGSGTTGDAAYGAVSIPGNGTYTRYIDNVTGPTLGLAFVVIGGLGACSFTVDNVDVRNISAGSVAAPYGLQYDGVDDFMLTASANFTATDAVTACMGVRKLSDAAIGLLFELSVSAEVTNGSFGMTAPRAVAEASYRFASRGTSTSGSAVFSGYPAPITTVVTGIGDISADTSILRANGAQIAAGVADQGTGNYGNHVVYFGRRGGTSVPLNGLDFGGAGIGRNSASITSSFEAFTANRTGVVL